VFFVQFHTLDNTDGFLAATFSTAFSHAHNISSVFENILDVSNTSSVCHHIFVVHSKISSDVFVPHFIASSIIFQNFGVTLTTSSQ
jgi:hypothetical protein